MTRFIAGIIVTIAVHLLGWTRFESAVHWLGETSRNAYTAAETQLRSSDGGAK